MICLRYQFLSRMKSSLDAPVSSPVGDDSMPIGEFSTPVGEVSVPVGDATAPEGVPELPIKISDHEPIVRDQP